MNPLAKVQVSVPGRPPISYEVFVERGGLSRLGTLCEERASAHGYALISDSRVSDLYAAAALESLRGTGRRAEAFAFPAGEWNKNREEWARLSDRLLSEGFGRDTVIVALGGGVTGDLAGFVASTFMRGVPVIHVPTTVLAMVDSSVGGKTGIDTPEAKNSIGSFHPPEFVLIDPDLLSTLQAFQLRAGLAESVKMAAMRDEQLFAWIESVAEDLGDGKPDTLSELVIRSVRLKASVVGEDPLEQGVRAILNFGHTAGHALEALSGYSLLHGEAVAHGMRLESRLGEALGLTEAGTAARLDSVLHVCGLPLELDPGLTATRVLDAARTDKKARRGSLRWSLPARIGEAARAADGDWTHELDASASVAHLDAALRTASEVRDSSA